MTLRERATANCSWPIPEPHPQLAWAGQHRAPSASGMLVRRQRTQSQNPAASQHGEARDGARIRILSIDGHPLFREGIASIINTQLDMVLVSQASTLQEAIQQYRMDQPDVTLLEIRQPDWDGIDALITIRSEFPAARVIIFTSLDGDVEVRRALKAGASGYLLKNIPPGELLQEIRKVHSGRKGIQAQLASKLAEHIGDQPLTAREVEVLAQLVRGNRNRDIGVNLSISEDTVKVHLRHIREKLRAKDRTEAIAIAVRRGIIRL